MSPVTLIDIDSHWLVETMTDCGTPLIGWDNDWLRSSGLERTDWLRQWLTEELQIGSRWLNKISFDTLLRSVESRLAGLRPSSSTCIIKVLWISIYWYISKYQWIVHTSLHIICNVCTISIHESSNVTIFMISFSNIVNVNVVCMSQTLQSHDIFKEVCDHCFRVVKLSDIRLTW